MRRCPLLVPLALTSCASIGTGSDDKNHTPPPTTVFVAPAGDDAAPGTRELPFRSIAHGLSVATAAEIVIAPGAYPESELVLSRRVALVGPEEGGASFAGHVEIRADEVVIGHLDIARGLAIAGARGVIVDASTLSAGDQKDALSIAASSAALTDLQLYCGAESCARVATSTATLRRAKIFGGTNAKRGLVVETSSVTVREVEVSGTLIDQILLGRGARAQIVDAKLDGGGGSALAAIGRVNLRALRVAIAGVKKMGVLVDGARAVLQNVSVASATAIGAGISGADVDLIELSADTSGDGAVSISAHDDRLSTVRMIGGTIRHGRKPGVLLSRGELTVQGTRFIGDAKAKTEDGEAIVASSADALLNVLSATIETPAGFGVSITNSASGTITATITKPRAGGIYIDGVAGAPVLIRGTRIEGCLSGSGIVVQDATDAKIVGSTIIGCPEAGILAGQGATVTVERTHLQKNTQYGVAAFGGAVLEISASRSTGSRWATFASCGDGARIEDAGSNRFTGPTTTCP